MRDFFNFKRMLIPIIIPTLFRLSIYFCIVAGIYQIIQHINLFGADLVSILLLAIYWLVLAPLFLRIICEVLIILSNINDSLTEIKNQPKLKHEE